MQPKSKMVPCSTCGELFAGRPRQREMHRMGYPAYCSRQCANEGARARHNGGLSAAEVRGRALKEEQRKRRRELEAVIEQRKQSGVGDAPQTIFEAMIYQGHDEDFAPTKEPEPTAALPQTREKLVVLRARLEAGEDLWNPQDAGVADSIANTESRLYSSLKARRITKVIRSI